MNELNCTPWPRACLQVYTGTGKGKTTAALGLSVRAAGRGMKVFIGQFMKGSEYGELKGIPMLGDLVHVEQFGSPECIPLREEPAPRDTALARKGLERIREVIGSRDYQIVVLDEVNVAVHFKLIDEVDLLALVDARPPDVEIICTGRYAPETLIERADLVTEMRAVKHPYDTTGLLARDGIER
ncbi:MAG: cob(I)yrinic acid a,c-diamide adenosyltransferase [Deltaproteobacteria bacterium]|nr:cob(I)yrinic acid a,c-diamide adenosyltransferase [Deltaproteobacteria bacterium]